MKSKKELGNKTIHILPFLRKHTKNMIKKQFIIVPRKIIVYLSMIKRSAEGNKEENIIV